MSNPDPNPYTYEPSSIPAGGQLPNISSAAFAGWTQGEMLVFKIPYADIAVPTLLIAGAKDRLREPGYAAPVAAKIADGRHVVLPDSGHCPQIENPKLVLGHLMKFLGPVSP